MNRYLYNGPVMEFQTCIMNCWKASTCAVSEDRARSNLAYQFKKQNHKLPGVKISLPGKLIII